MRNKISSLFGFLLPIEESIISYLGRMDKIGQLDQLKLYKIVAIMAEEIEKQNLDIAEIKSSIEKLTPKKEDAKTTAKV